MHFYIILCIYIYRYTWYTHAHTHKKAQKIGWRAARHLQDFPRPLGRSHRTRCSALLGDGASLHDLLRFFFWKWNIRLWINTYRYIFRGMNIHLPAILMFTRGTRFWHTAIWIYCLLMVVVSFIFNLLLRLWDDENFNLFGCRYQRPAAYNWSSIWTFRWAAGWEESGFG